MNQVYHFFILMALYILGYQKLKYQRRTKYFEQYELTRIPYTLDILEEEVSLSKQEFNEEVGILEECVPAKFEKISSPLRRRRRRMGYAKGPRGRKVQFHGWSPEEPWACVDWDLRTCTLIETFELGFGVQALELWRKVVQIARASRVKRWWDSRQSQAAAAAESDGEARCEQRRGRSGGPHQIAAVQSACGVQGVADATRGPHSRLRPSHALVHRHQCQGMDSPGARSKPILP